MESKAMWFMVSLATVLLEAVAAGQTSSLFQRDLPVQNKPLLVEGSSWTHIPVPPPHEISRHDIVTIRVDELSRMQSEGDVQRRKTALNNSVLAEWVRLSGLSLKPAPQSDGDLRVQGSTTQTYRAEAEMETRESLAFVIAAEVSDIRPNGNLVLTAHKQLGVNNENWQYSLIGECRREDVGPDNIVLSRNLYNLNVHKRDRGHVRDSYRRGWLLRFMDLVNPF